MRGGDLPDFSTYCEAACKKLWGAPAKDTPKQMCWNGGDDYSYRTFDKRKHVWYDAATQRGGSTLELAAFARNEPAPTNGLRGEAFFRDWEWLHDNVLPNMPPPPKPNGGTFNIVATYDYRDEAGSVLFQVVKLDPKDFRQRRPDKSKPSGWDWSVKGVRAIPYRLPELTVALAQDRIVFITEGEKDTDALRRLGMPATTNAGGVGKWRPELSEFLRNADVVILPDRDPQRTDTKTGELMFHPDGRPILPGQDHAQDIAASLTGIASRVRVLELWQSWPAMPLKGDVSNWIANGGTAEQLYALADGAPDWQPPERIPANDPPQDQPATDEDEGHWHGEANPNDSRTWAIHDLVPEVGKGLIAGQWGTYKTFTALDMAHALMSGVSFLGFDVVRQGGVAFFALEGESEIPIRLQALIDQRGVIKGKAPFVWYDNAPTLLARGAAKALVKRINKAAAKMQANFGVPLVAVFIDTIIVGAGYTKDGGDNDTATTNRVLGTMAEVARQTGCFVFGIDHFGKDVNVGTRGNSTKEGNADVVLALLGDKAITGEVSNCRLALRKRRSGPNGQEFPFRPRLVDMGCDQDGRPMTTLVLDWGKTNPTAAAKPGADDWGKGKGVKLLRRIVMNLLINQGIDLKPAADEPTVRAISVELVRVEFLKAHYADPEGGKAKQQHAKRVAFKRALDAATDNGALTVRDINGQDYAWVTDGTEPR